jgi:hypothetical protein
MEAEDLRDHFSKQKLERLNVAGAEGAQHHIQFRRLEFLRKVEMWQEADYLGMMQQMGAIPSR